MLRCENCGAENDPGTDFCVSCHEFLEWETAQPPAPERPDQTSGVDDFFSRAAANAARQPPARPPEVVEPVAVEPEVEVPVTREPVEVAEGAAEDAEVAGEFAEAAVAEDEVIEVGEAAAPVAPSGPLTGVQHILEAIDTGRQIASSRGRADLDRHLGQTKARLGSQDVTVVVAGEFKRGKSTLVNALLQRDVCPVDADVVTAVPTTVRYAEQLRVTTYAVGDDGERVDEQEASLDSLASLVTEKADPADPHRQRAVEVGLPHRMLQSGLCLVDTPGVGGLDSAHGFLTLGALRYAQAVLFVTDAAQELTGPELSFLRTALERCPLTALVLTKTDLYPQWRRIVELDRGHLAAAGLSVPVIAVSSFLRLRATQDRRLDAESGFEGLVEFLARDVVRHSREAAARAAAQEVEFVAAQLEQQSQAELTVISEPERSGEVVAELAQAQRQATKLALPTATWQQTLTDGIQDLVSDIEHDLQSRLRQVLHEVEEIIDEGDPQQAWEDTEVWLRRQVAMQTVANRDLLLERAEQLAVDVATQFDLQSGTGIAVQLSEVGEGLDAITLAGAETLVMPGGKLAPLMVAARSGFYLPMMIGSFAVHAFGGPLTLAVHLSILGVSAALGAGIGGKIIKDERKRQRTYRQQQAKAAVRRFVDEVMFLVNKQSRDGLRSTQRQLRDDFQARALLLQGSATAALQAAHRTSGLSDEQQRTRGQELAEQGARLGEVRAAARELVSGDV